MNLINNRIGDEGMGHLAQVLREQPEGLRSLSTLDLEDNDIGDEGIGHLA